MPLARVSFSHILASAGFLRRCASGRAGGIGGGDVGGELAVQHGIADASLQAASPDGRVIVGAALVVAWNHAAILPRRSRLGPPRTLPPRLAKKKLSGFFSLAMASYFCHSSKTRSLNTRQYAGVPGGGSLLQIAQWQSGRLPSGGQPLV